jgi:hypothetical protein
MNIMRLTEKGIDIFKEFIEEAQKNPSTIIPKPSQLFQDSEYAESIEGCNISYLDELNLDDKLETARALHELVELLELKSPETDIGFWAWCSAYLYDRLRKKNKPGELAIWIPQPRNWKRYYRHYLCSIWMVYSTHKADEEKLVILLSGKVNTPGELWGQFAATQDTITNPSLLGVIYQLYWDKDNNKRKYGSGGESPRRLMAVLKQLKCNWDLFSQTSEKIIEMLPAEFERFSEQNSLV